MCNCIIVGNVKIIDGAFFIGDQEIKDVPKDLLNELNKGKFKCKINNKGVLTINNYKYKNGKFRKTFRAWIKYNILGG